MALRLRGPIRADVIERSVNAVVQRHDSLRTVFGDAQGARRQIVKDAMPIVLSHNDPGGKTSRDRVRAARSLLRTEARMPFDLTSGPLVRAGLIRLSPDDHIFFFAIQHIVSDLWSMKIFLNEIALAYRDYLHSGAVSLDPLAVQYADFACWQREWFRGRILAREVEYWQQTLHGLSPQPANRNLCGAPAAPGEGAVISLAMTENLSAQIETACRQNRVTLFMLILSALKALLFRQTGQDDLAISSLAANRTHPELDSAIGLFANRIIFRTQISGSLSFHEFLGRVRASCLSAYDHQELPLGKILTISGHSNRSVNTPWSLALQSAPVAFTSFTGVAVDPFECTGVTMFEDGERVEAHAEQAWQIWKRGEKTILVLVYRMDVLERGAAAAALEDLQTILTTVACDIDRRIDELPVRTGCRAI